MSLLFASECARGERCPAAASSPWEVRVPRLASAAFFLVIAGFSGPDAAAQAHRMQAARAGLLESGAPLYSIRSQDALGLNESPTDIHRLPDGRMLVLAGNEIAFGDGSRWEIFHQAADDTTIPSVGVAVDADGVIYMGVAAGFARVEFQDDGHWRLQVISPWSAAEGSSLPILRHAVQVGGQWFWHSGTGAVFSWHPGEVPRFRGRAESVEQVLHLEGSFYLSDRTTGRLWRLTDGAMEPVMREASVSVSETLTCGVSLEPGQLLVGTYARGLAVFDGQRVRPFGEDGILSGGVRINDLCETEGGYFAAAVENVGIVFFDHQGHTVQVLDRALDHRLSHVRRLVAAPGGVVWGQVNEGVLRVEFPSRLSHFEPLIGSGLAVAHPDRLNGQLWVMADGKAHRGVYDAEGRLVRLEEDTPPDRFAFAFSCALGWPVVGTGRGAYFRNDKEWKEFFPLSGNLRILQREPVDGRWLYGAVGEVGWLRPTATGIEVEQRIPVSGLGNLYNAVSSRDGTIWFELGNRQVGRLRLVEGGPQVDLFDRQDGLPEGWVNLFCIGDDVGFNVEGQILRFDEGTHHFQPDETFAQRFPGLTNIVGRPARDARGRVWISANGAVQIFASRGDRWVNLEERMPPGFQPIFYTLEDNGVVWMFAERRLARFDPALPMPEYVPLRAMITRVNLPGSGRTVMPVAEALPSLEYADNSLIASFVAAGNPVGAPVHFDVRLDGNGGSWTPVGANGTAAFNRLKEGKYLLHVRPQTGGVVGQETTLALTVLSPWYRTTGAYVAYVAGAIGVILLATWVAVLITRREKRRLQDELARRTQQVDELATRLVRVNEEALASRPEPGRPVSETTV